MQSDCFHSSERPRQAVRPPASPAIRRVVSHIEQNFADRLPLSELASIAEINLFTLVTVFRREVGIPPHQYVCYVRIREAKALLRSGLPPALAASEAGFFDQSHLSRHFKRLCGMTPGQYIAQNVLPRPSARVRPSVQARPSVQGAGDVWASA